MFAGSCIGVLLLVMLLELLRRIVKEYDALLVRKHSTNNNSTMYVEAAGAVSRAQQAASESGESKDRGLNVHPVGVAPSGRFRPTLLEQAVRALLHMCQFSVAYFVMLYAIL